MNIQKKPAAHEAASSDLESARNLFDAGYHLVNGLLDCDLVSNNPVHCLSPHVLVIENSELVVLRELERCRAGFELVVYRPEMTIGLPKLGFLADLRHREPASERALDVGRQVVFLQHEFYEFLGVFLILGIRKDRANLDGSTIDHWLPAGLLREARGRNQFLVRLLARRTDLRSG